MNKKSVFLVMLFLVIITLAGCDDGSNSSTTVSSSIPGYPTPIPGSSINVYGYVFLGDSIKDPVGVKFTFINPYNTYSAATESSQVDHNYYRLNNVIPGIYSVYVDFSGSSISTLLSKPPQGYFFDWATKSGSIFAFNPSGTYPAISGSTNKVEIYSYYSDSPGTHLLWLLMAPSQH